MGRKRWEEKDGKKKMGRKRWEEKDAIFFYVFKMHFAQITHYEIPKITQYLHPPTHSRDLIAVQTLPPRSIRPRDQMFRQSPRGSCP